MTLLEREPDRSLAGPCAARSSRPRGWCCARPRPDDAKAITALINDRRIAENMATHPASLYAEGCEAFIADARRRQAACS